VTLFSDIEYLSKRSIKEALHYAKASHTPEKIAAHRWYIQNKGRVAKLQARLKRSKGLQKKKAIMAKSGRTLTGKKKKKYRTKNHTVNEYGFAAHIKENKIGENISIPLDLKLKRNIRKDIDYLLTPGFYRVVQEFTIGEVNVLLSERFEYYGSDTWSLFKHNGKVWNFGGLEKKEIEDFITEED